MSSPSLNHFIPIQSNLQCVSWNILQSEPRQSSQVSWPRSNGATPATLQPIGSLANPHTLIHKRQWDCMRIDCESKSLLLIFHPHIYLVQCFDIVRVDNSYVADSHIVEHGAMDNIWQTALSSSSGHWASCSVLWFIMPTFSSISQEKNQFGQKF